MATVDATPIVKTLQDACPDAVLEPSPSVDLQETFYVSREHALDVLRALRDRSDLRFSLLAELTAADFWPREPRFELVYTLVSLEHRRRVRVKVQAACRSRPPADGERHLGRRQLA